MLLLLVVRETLKESRTRRLKTNAHVMCDQRGEKKSKKVSLRCIFARTTVEKKRRKFFFSRENFSFFSSSIFFREREKEYDDDDDVCEQCEYHWTRRAR
jgi:hypothetical protein